MPQPTVYPHELIDPLIAALSAIQNEAPSQAAIPPPERLQALLDAAWSASLLEEEGRRAVFTLGYITERDARQVSGRVLALAQGLPCTAQMIAKLALATDPRETVLAVQWTAAGELEIWGLLQLGAPTFSIDVEIRPRFLHVTGFRPGGLVVESHGRRLLLYMNGIAHWYGRHAEKITMLLRDALHATAVRLGSTGSALAHEFERLAERLVLAGHGGALLIADPGGSDPHAWQPCGVHIPAGMRFRRANTCLRDAFLQDESAARKGDDVGSATRLERDRDHLSALDHVARLSNVDGAVVMGPDLSVYGFGATIELTDETDLPGMLLCDLSTPERPPQSITIAAFPGHRHKSAVHFCAMQRRPGETRMGLAIVASQDGTLSLFGLTTTGLAVYRPFILRSVSVR